MAQHKMFHVEQILKDELDLLTKAQAKDRWILENPNSASEIKEGIKKSIADRAEKIGQIETVLNKLA